MTGIFKKIVDNEGNRKESFNKYEILRLKSYKSI